MSWFARMFRWERLSPRPPSVEAEEVTGVYRDGLERLREATRSMGGRETSTFREIENLEKRIRDGVDDARKVFEKKP